MTDGVWVGGGDGGDDERGKTQMQLKGSYFIGTARSVVSAGFLYHNGSRKIQTENKTCFVQTGPASNQRVLMFHSGKPEITWLKTSPIVCLTEWITESVCHSEWVTEPIYHTEGITRTRIRLLTTAMSIVILTQPSSFKREFMGPTPKSSIFHTDNSYTCCMRLFLSFLHFLSYISHKGVTDRAQPKSCKQQK